MADFDVPLLRYTVDDEPNEDWTVEEVFQWTLLRSYKLVDEKFAHLAQGLREEMQQGGTHLEQVRQEANTAANENHPNQPSSAAATTTNQATKSHVMNHTATSAATTTNTTTAPTNTASTTITVQAKVIASDVYTVGRLFELRLNKKTIGWVGRSSSKKFRQHGLSLSKDLEVSTTHGKFFVNSDNGRVYYTDTGSTNGSKMDGTTLQVDVPYLVENGTRLFLGATEFQFAIT